MRSDHLRGEAAFLPSSLEELEVVRQRLLDHGISPAVTGGIVAWLLAKAHGADDPTNGATRTRYRKILADIGVPIGTGPESGRARRAVMPAVTGAGAAVALVPSRPTGAVLALLAGLYVTRSGGEELELEVAA
jgi:hypothetical protein